MLNFKFFLDNISIKLYNYNLDKPSLKYFLILYISMQLTFQL